MSSFFYAGCLAPGDAELLYVTTVIPADILQYLRRYVALEQIPLELTVQVAVGLAVTGRSHDRLY